MSPVLPMLSDVSRGFYDGCRQGRLLYQRCRDCEETVFFPRKYCPGCLGENLAWQESSGKGTIHSFTVTRSFAPSEFSALTPYVLAVVKLEEGFKLMTNIVNAPLDGLRCEQPVRVVFERVDGDITLPKFEPL